VEIALRAAGVGPGDEVILSAYDYPGNFRSIELLGARPVLIDVAPDSVQPDPRQLSQADSDAVKAVIISHLFGTAADVVAIRRWCRQRQRLLIEDACQVPGMLIGGRPAGSWGDFGTLSFGGSKPLSSGCGGAVLTRDRRLAARLGPLLDRPSDVMPLSPLQAATLGPQLNQLDALNQRRRATVTHIESQIVPHLRRWRWLSGCDRSVEAAHYKVAWAVPDARHRNAILSAAVPLGLPIGEGFRSQARVSERRCRKPVPLCEAQQMDQCVFVLDHTALLLEPLQWDALAESLIQLHDGTQ
jgi:dTDP-4-amino-4,6-dideoxygalactose transaminase